jgi:hypothetical protein
LSVPTAQQVVELGQAIPKKSVVSDTAVGVPAVPFVTGTTTPEDPLLPTAQQVVELTQEIAFSEVVPLTPVALPTLAEATPAPTPRTTPATALTSRATETSTVATDRASRRDAPRTLPTFAVPGLRNCLTIKACPIRLAP